MEGRAKEPFPASFRKRLRPCKEELQKAGLWYFIVQIRDPLTYREEVVRALVSSAAADPKHFTMQAMGYELLMAPYIPSVLYQLPDSRSSTPLERVKEPTKKTWTEIFPDGKEAYCDPETQMCDFTEAREPWNALFSFVNVFFCFEQSAVELPLSVMRMAVAALDGIRMNWSELLVAQMHRATLQVKGGDAAATPLKNILTNLYEKSLKHEFARKLTTGTESGEASGKKADMQAAGAPRLKRTTVDSGSTPDQSGAADFRGQGNTSKKARTEVAFTTTVHPDVVKQIVAGMTEQIAEGGVHVPEPAAKNVRVVELEEALRKSRSETQEMARSNANLRHRVKTYEDRLQAQEERFEAREAELKARALESDGFEKQLRAQDDQLKAQEAQLRAQEQRIQLQDRELKAKESESGGTDECIVRRQTAYIKKLVAEAEARDTLLAQRDRELEAERAAQDGRTRQLRAKDAAEAQLQQRQALSALETQLADAQAQLGKMTAAQVQAGKATGASTSEEVEVVREETTKLDGIKSRVWEWERTLNPPSQSLFATYESQRDLFLVLEQLDAKHVMDFGTFQQLWTAAESTGNRALIAEMLVRGDLEMDEWARALPALGDMEVQSLRYYSELEARMRRGRSAKPDPGNRVPTVQRHVQAIQNALSDMPQSQLREWQETLDAQAQFLSDEATLEAVITNSRERQRSSELEEITASSYGRSFASALSRIYRTVGPLRGNRKPPAYIVQSSLQADGKVRPAPARERAPLQTIQPAAREERFLGSYERLFDHFSEPPFVSWKAIEWVLKDFGLSRTVEKPVDKIMRERSDAPDTPWTVLPPRTVRSDPRFCPCERRYRWDPAATIDGVEYNWPRIPGPFYSFEDCATAYGRFFDAHRTHRDPVCFRAAVFCAILAQWCRDWRLCIDINVYDAGKKEFWLLSKLQYRSARFHRLLEAMAISNFIAGVHHAMVNENASRYTPCVRFLLHQARYNYKEIRADEQLLQQLAHAKDWERKQNKEYNNRRRPL